MADTQQHGRLVRRYVLETIGAGSANVVQDTARRFNISRQAVNKHLRRLQTEGLIVAQGTTRSRQYELAVIHRHTIDLNLDTQRDENLIWRRQIAPLVADAAVNAKDIWAYGCQEMLNNAIDHSSGTKITVRISSNVLSTIMTIEDDGYGVFRKIRESMNLEDERHAVFELSKGKLTTAPNNHTGEGIFFTSRMFDFFSISSGNVYFAHKSSDENFWVLENDASVAGTTIHMELSNSTKRTSKEVFDQFSNEDYAFSKTVVPVNLARYDNDALLSRSQARRVLARVDRFSTVLLNFENVEHVGQAFADEVFRVFANAHPQIEIVPIRANPQVMAMIKRARANSG